MLGYGRIRGSKFGLDEPHEAWTPKLVRDLCDTAPEMIIGDTIGGTLKRLKIATTARTMDHTVTWIEAVSLADGLGLALPLDFGARPATPETTEKRQRRRYRMCVEDGLQMPDNDYARLPRGVGRLAEKEGVTRPAFTAEVKAHIARLAKQRKENGK